MIASEGPTNSGKSEFTLSAPGPGIFIALDRNYDGMLDNPNPPPTRNQDDFLYVPVDVKLPTSVKQEEAMESWKLYTRMLYAALDNPDARTVVIDGDSDSFELQTLAAFGKVAQIPQIMRTGLNAARRALIARCWDSGKIIIATNKLKRKYENQYNADGSPIMDVSKPGQILREWDGVSYERQGFNDHDYLWQIQLKHLYDRDKKRWGVQILKAKANPQVEGEVLWGSLCNMPTLLETIYPHIDMAEWGYR